MMGWRGLLEEGSRAGGVVHLASLARRHAVAPSVAYERARREGWWHPLPGVFGLPGLTPDADAWSRAALSYVGKGRPDTLAAITRHTALHLHGVARVAPTRTQVVVAAGCGVASTSRVQVIRSRDLERRDIGVVRGIAIGTAPRVVRDLASVIEVDPLRDAVIDLLQRRTTSLRELQRRLGEWPRFPGRGRLRLALQQLADAGRTDAGLEYRVRTGLEAEGVPLDRGQVAVPVADGATIHLDLGITAIRFGIEVDSMLAHSERRDLLIDVRRSNALARHDDDWRVLRCTWEVLRDGWPRFVEEVRELVAAQARRHLGVPWPRPQDLSS